MRNQRLSQRSRIAPSHPLPPLLPVGVRDADEIERAITALARVRTAAGLIMVGPISSVQVIAS
jgi:hypothetical protein